MTRTSFVMFWPQRVPSDFHYFRLFGSQTSARLAPGRLLLFVPSERIWALQEGRKEHSCETSSCWAASTLQHMTICLYINEKQIPWIEIVLDKVIVFQQPKKFPEFYKARRIIFAFIRSRIGLILLCHMTSVHALSPYPFKLNFSIILTSTVKPSKWSLPFRFSDKNFVHIFHISLSLPAFSFFLLIVIIKVRESRKIWHFSLFSLHQCKFWATLTDITKRNCSGY